MHEKLVDLDKNSRQRRNKNVMFTVYNCSQLNSLDSHISSQTQPLTLKSGQQVKQVNVCKGFSLFMLRTVILPAVSIIFF